MFGILNVYKPESFTSHDVVNKLRKILSIKKIGHTGTLDPMAVGVLPVCIGKATKIIKYLEQSKSYKAFIKLGVATDTYDLDGKIIRENTVNLKLSDIIKYLMEFQGKITQTPPMFSAVHYKGKRLYEYARKNIAIKDVPRREVFIESINLEDIADKSSKNPILIVNINCSRGTYIRSIAHDLGVKLGYGACLSNLIRTRSGNFSLDKSYKIEQIEDHYLNNKLDKIIINPYNVIDLRAFEISKDEFKRISQGQYLQRNSTICDEEELFLIYNSRLIAVARAKENKIFPINVFV